MPLSIENVWFKYPESDWVLKGINLKLGYGFYCIVGKNGSGKTTLLRVIAGMLRPQRGYVAVNGKRVRSYKDALGKVIYLPSNPTTFLVGPRIGDDFKRAGVSEDLIQMFSAERIMNKGIFEASEGERRIAAAITALAYDVDIVLLDEVTVGLDKELRTKLVEALKEVGQRKIILLATNDFRIIPFCDEILFLRNGCIEAKGPPKSIIDKVPYLSRNQTVSIYKALIQNGADLELDKKSVISMLVRFLCSI